MTLPSALSSGILSVNSIAVKLKSESGTMLLADVKDISVECFFEFASCSSHNLLEESLQLVAVHDVSHPAYDLLLVSSASPGHHREVHLMHT